MSKHQHDTLVIKAEKQPTFSSIFLGSRSQNYFTSNSTHVHPLYTILPNKSPQGISSIFYTPFMPFPHFTYSKLGLIPSFSGRTHTVNISAVDFHTSLDHPPSLTHCRALNRMRPATIQANFPTNKCSHDVCTLAHKSDKSH